MCYDKKKAIKQLNKLIGYLSDLIINEEDAEYPDEDLIKYYSEKQNDLTQLKHYFSKGIKMINIPQDFNNNPFADKKFKELIDFFNKLEKNLQYPNCEGYADAKRILSKAQDDLILLGII